MNKTEKQRKKDALLAELEYLQKAYKRELERLELYKAKYTPVYAAVMGIINTANRLDNDTIDHQGTTQEVSQEVRDWALSVIEQGQELINKLESNE